MKTKKDDLSAKLLKAMGDPTRLKILLMLEGKARSVNEIVSFFNLSQPTITRHLQTLASAGLVVRTKEGQTVFYQVSPQTMQSLCCNLVACFPCCSVTITPHNCCSDSMPLKFEKTPYKGGANIKPSGNRKGGKR
jgi:DNA-binding transcriptional ArsR family regulator